MPPWLKVTGKRIIELPIMELAMAMPDINGDLPINLISTIRLFQERYQRLTEALLV
jgi:hypothetical protein